MLISAISIIIILLCHFLGMSQAALILGGILWCCYGFVYEKKIWDWFFCDHLRDRIASMLLVLMAMIAAYVCVYACYSTVCLHLAVFQCLLYSGWKTYQTQESKNAAFLVIFFILSGVSVVLIK